MTVKIKYRFPLSRCMWKRRWQQAGQALKILQKPSSFRCELYEDYHDDYHDELDNDDCDDGGGDCDELTTTPTIIIAIIIS